MDYYYLTILYRGKMVLIKMIFSISKGKERENVVNGNCSTTVTKS